MAPITPEDAANRVRDRLSAVVSVLPVADGFKVLSDKTDLQAQPPELYVQFNGPTDTPYEGGTFTLGLKINEYPFKGPRVRYMHPVFHPHIMLDGSWIDHPMFRKWDSSIPLGKLLVMLKAHLANTGVTLNGPPTAAMPGEPEIDLCGRWQCANDDGTCVRCISGEAGTAWMKDAREAKKKAREYTATHAVPM